LSTAAACVVEDVEGATEGGPGEAEAGEGEVGAGDRRYASAGDRASDTAVSVSGERRYGERLRLREEAAAGG
jgi:hypothetical protein